MKRLGLLGIISIMLFGVIGGLHHAKAQSATTPNYDYFYTKGVGVFNTSLSSLSQVREAQAATAESANKQKILGQIDENINLVRQTRQAYLDAFASNRAGGISPTDTQIAAVVAGRAKFNQVEQAESIGAKQEPRSQAIVKVFINNFDGNSGLLTEAKKIQNGTLDTSSPIAGTYGTTDAIATAGTSVSAVIKKDDVSKCSELLKSSIVDCIDASMTWFIKHTLLEFAGFLVWLAGNMFNYAVQFGILNFATLASDQLYPVWAVIRQITSLFVVFAGLWLGIMYIAGKGEQFTHYVPWVCVFALFVNFSYPGTRLLVDVSNVTSLNIYASSIGTSVLTSDSVAALATGGADTAGALIVSRLGLQGLVSSATAVNQPGQGFASSITSTPGALIAVAFVFYAAYVLFVATGLIVARTAVLVFLIVASPLLLIDSVVPALGDKAAMLRKVFFQQLVVAPVFMIMLALTLKFLEIFNNAGVQGGGLSQFSTNNTSSAVVMFFNTIMMLVMLNIMLRVTKSISAGVGEYATKKMGQMGGFGIAGVAGGTGFLARNTLGVAAARVRDSKWVEGMQGTYLGQKFKGAMGAVSSSSMDLRGSKPLSGLMKMGGIDSAAMGKAPETSYDKEFKKREEKMTSEYNSIKDKDAKEAFLNQRMGQGIGARLLRGGGAGRDVLSTDAQLLSAKLAGDKDKLIKKYLAMSPDRQAEFLAEQPSSLRAEMVEKGEEQQKEKARVAAIENTKKAQEDQAKAQAAETIENAKESSRQAQLAAAVAGAVSSALAQNFQSIAQNRSGNQGGAAGEAQAETTPPPAPKPPTSSPTTTPAAATATATA